jgi:hypothetical protein
MNEQKMRQLHVDLQPGDADDVVHHVKIGFKEHATYTTGVVCEEGATAIWRG